MTIINIQDFCYPPSKYDELVLVNPKPKECEYASPKRKLPCQNCNIICNHVNHNFLNHSSQQVAKYDFSKAYHGTISTSSIEVYQMNQFSYCSI